MTGDPLRRRAQALGHLATCILCASVLDKDSLSLLGQPNVFWLTILVVVLAHFGLLQSKRVLLLVGLGLLIALLSTITMTLGMTIARVILASSLATLTFAWALMYLTIGFVPRLSGLKHLIKTEII